ncbi:hypothetical protein BD769DRAFT_1396433 [Suillus cothurnatus]|nr:hypothetical protein BD769DRAFT_1396433 [Suillus cothurnatus]
MTHSTQKVQHFVSGYSTRQIQLCIRRWSSCSDIEIHDFDENTAAALLLSLAPPVGDLEVPDPVGRYSIENEDFFQNLKESETSGLDDKHSQLGDEEESESEDSAEYNEEPKTNEDIIDIPLHVPVNGVLDTLTMTSNISWDAFHCKIAGAMEISLEDLSIVYKFSTDVNMDFLHKLNSAHNLLQLFVDASCRTNAHMHLNIFQVHHSSSITITTLYMASQSTYSIA